jgi:hypothetical protein
VAGRPEATIIAPLFAMVAELGSVFQQVLKRLWQRVDHRWLQLLEATEGEWKRDSFCPNSPNSSFG